MLKRHFVHIYSLEYISRQIYKLTRHAGLPVQVCNLAQPKLTNLHRYTGKSVLICNTSATGLYVLREMCDLL